MTTQITTDDERRRAATEEVMRTAGLTPEDLPGLEPEDQEHWRLTVDEALASPAGALVRLGRAGAHRLWPGVVAP